MEVKIDHGNEEFVITVKGSIFGGINVKQGDDLIYIGKEKIRGFVAAVRAVASDTLGEEV